MLYRGMDGSEDDLELLNKHDDEEEHRILKGCFSNAEPVHWSRISDD